MIHIFDSYIRLRAGTDCHIAPSSVSIAVAADCHLSGTGQLMILGLDRSRPVAHSDIFIRLYAGFRTDSNRVIDGPLRRQLGNPFHITGQADRIFIPFFSKSPALAEVPRAMELLPLAMALSPMAMTPFYPAAHQSRSQADLCLSHFQGQRAGFTADRQRTGAFRMGIVADGRSPHIISRCRIADSNRRRSVADAVIPY